MKKLLLVLLIALSGTLDLKASHLMGAEITYKHIAVDDYEVTLIIYGDCSGIDLSTDASVNFISASCGLNFTETFNLDSIVEVSQLCSSSLGSSTCNGGTLPGTKKWVYSGVVTMAACSDWVISWTDGSRNPAITNLVNPDFEDLYIEATLNNILGVNNNSPQYLALPTPYLCANQLNIFNHGASDLDGDSLYYQFAQPLSAAGAPIAYTAGYSITNPILTTGGMNLNPETGEMCFTPSQGQICVVSVLVSEFRNNVLIGTQIREMQVVVSTGCVGSAPTAGGAAATCGGGGALTVDYMGSSVTQVDDNSFVMCPDDSLCFTIPFADVDGDNVSIVTNIETSIPTANFSINGNGTQNASLSFCWMPTPLDSGVNVITVQISDDACPISSSQYYTYDITIFDQPYAGEDQIICGTQTAGLQAFGGGGYIWSILSGDTATANLSCTNCDYVIVDPDITTTYLLTSTLAAACENTDTVTVFVVPDFTPTAFGDTTLCDYLTVQLSVTTTGPVGTYGFLWNNENTLDNNTIQNPIASPLQSTYYVVEVTSPDGCVKKEDSVYISVNPPPVLQLFPGDTTICDGEIVTFDINSECNYSLQMSDPGFGDGWNGQSIDVYDNGVLIGNYTLLSTDNNGDSLTINFPVINGNNIVLIYNTGSFQSESAFNLIDGTGSIISTYAQGSMVGLNTGDTLYNGIVNCGPLLTDFSYSWSPSTYLSDPLIKNPTLTQLDSTESFTVSITDTATGCLIERSFEIELFEGFNPVASPDTIICPGQQVTLGVTGDFLTFAVEETCQETATVTGQDDSPSTIATVNSFSCVPVGAPITSVLLDASFTGSQCPSWYTYDIIINGTTQFTQQCNQTGLDLSAFLPITSVSISSNDEDNFSDNVTLNLSLTIIYETFPISFSWTPAINLSDSTISNPIFNGPTTSSYAVDVFLVDRPLCKGTSDPIIIEINNNDLPTITGDSAVCVGEPVTYTISGADSIIWPDNSFAPSYTYTPLDDDLLTVTASTFCGDITWNKHVVVYPEIDITASPDTIICDGDMVNLNLTGLLNECTYLLTLIDSAGNGWSGFEGVDIKINGVLYEAGVSVQNCGGTYCTTSMVIPINDGDVLTLEYTSGATDAENTVQLYDASNTELLNITSPTTGVIGTFNTSCNNAYDITWSPSAQLSDATITNPIFNASTPETLGATVFLNANPNCVGTSNTIYLDVRSIDVPDIVGDTVICIGTTVSLNINADSVLWWGDTTNVSTTFTFTPQQDSLVTVTATTFCVKNAVTTHYVAVNPLPIINTISDTTITIQDVITLTTTGGEIYSWSPDIYLNCNDCSDPIASPDETTTYQVTVTDSNGCVSSRTINIEVLIPDLFIPSGFSPNGDGVNDLVEVRSLSIVSMNIKIYDRWGALIFESNDQERSWDGTFNGTNLDAGVYVYKFESKMVDGMKIEQSGTITLFR